MGNKYLFGIFNNIKNLLTPNSAKFMNIQEFYLRVQMGQFTDYSTMSKFGINPLIATDTDPEDIWEYGGQYTYSTTADITTLSSSDNSDTQSIKVTGLGADGSEIIQTKTLTGQTPVALDTALLRVYRMENEADSGSDIAGTVYCYVGTTQTDGVPDNATDVRAIITDGNNQTLMALYTIPLGKVGFFVEGSAGISFAGLSPGTQAAKLQLRSRRYGKVFKVKKEISVVATGSNNYFEKRAFPDVVPALTDISSYVKEVSASIGAWASYDILLVDEDYFSSSYLTAIGQPSSV